MRVTPKWPVYHLLNDHRLSSPKHIPLATPWQWTKVPWKGTILKGNSSPNHWFSGANALVSGECTSMVTRKTWRSLFKHVMSYWSWLLEKSLFYLFQTSYKQILLISPERMSGKLASQPTPNLFPSRNEAFWSGLIKGNLMICFWWLWFPKKSCQVKDQKKMTCFLHFWIVNPKPLLKRQFD